MMSSWSLVVDLLTNVFQGYFTYTGNYVIAPVQMPVHNPNTNEESNHENTLNQHPV